MAINKTPITTELAQKNKIQTKILTSNITSNGEISDLTFNNLEIGKWYSVGGQISLAVNQAGADEFVSVEYTHDGGVIGEAVLSAPSPDNGGGSTYGINISFQATATSLTFVSTSATTAARVNGNGSKQETYIQLEERNDLEETTDFT